MQGNQNRCNVIKFTTKSKEKKIEPMGFQVKKIFFIMHYCKMCAYDGTQ